MAIVRPGAKRTAPLATGAKRRTAARQLFCLARGMPPLAAGEKSWRRPLRMAVRGFSRPRPDQPIRGKRGAKSPSSEGRLARSSVSETTERRTGARHPPRERGCCREEKRSRSSLWEPFKSSRRINARRKRVPVLQLQPIGSEAMRSCRGDMAETDRCASAMLAETAPRSRSPVGDCFWRDP